MKRTALKRKTPLRSKAAKKKRTTSQRCAKQRCNRRAEVVIEGEWRKDPDSEYRARLIERLCKPHAKRLADKYARQVVLYRDGYRCQRCGRTDREGVMIQWAHIHRRGMSMPIRWEPDNALALCGLCHEFFTYREEEWRAWLDLNYPGLWDRMNHLRIYRRAIGWKPDYAALITDLRAQVEGARR